VIRVDGRAPHELALRPGSICPPHAGQPEHLRGPGRAHLLEMESCHIRTNGLSGLLLWGGGYRGSGVILRDN
jgi:hypothetical protein